MEKSPPWKHVSGAFCWRLRKIPKTELVESAAYLTQKVEGDITLRQAGRIGSVLLLASLCAVATVYPSLCDCSPICLFLLWRGEKEIDLSCSTWILQTEGLKISVIHRPLQDIFPILRIYFSAEMALWVLTRVERNFSSIGVKIDVGHFVNPRMSTFFSLYFNERRGKSRKGTQLVFRRILKNGLTLETVLHGTRKLYPCTAAFRPNKTH